MSSIFCQYNSIHFTWDNNIPTNIEVTSKANDVINENRIILFKKRVHGSSVLLIVVPARVSDNVTRTLSI